MESTRRSLKMHNKLLLDVIRRQAGSLHKAVLEGVMNAIEAGASKVDIVYTEPTPGSKAHLCISDDGKGIQSITEIESFFETFGTPHAESEGKIWAQFRMGRGQLFSFGRNTWRTGSFEMFIDIEGMGLDYNLKQNMPTANGCQVDVDLYTYPFPSYYPSVDALKREIQEQIEYMQTPVFFNGKQINKDPRKLKWTHQDDDAYYMFGVGNGLTIYNLGAYVKRMETYKTGVEGIIVSKHQLKVNFARNDVQSDCVVFNRINEVIRKNRRVKARKERTILTNNEKISMLLDLQEGGISYEDVRHLPLLLLSNNRSMKLQDLAKNRIFWSFAKSYDNKADRLMQRETAIVFDDAMLSKLRYDGEPQDFFHWVTRDRGDRCWDEVRNLYRPFEKLTETMNDGFRLIPTEKLTPKEKVILRVLSSQRNWSDRSLAIGLHNTALAWTDGSTYIAMDRNWLEGLHIPGPHGCAELVNTLAHELAHEEDSSGTHVHGEEFYQKFHDICVCKDSPQSILPRFYDKMNESKLAYRTEKIVAKETKKQAKLHEALGVAALES